MPRRSNNLTRKPPAGPEANNATLPGQTPPVLTVRAPANWRPSTAAIRAVADLVLCVAAAEPPIEVRGDETKKGRRDTNPAAGQGRKRGD